MHTAAFSSSSPPFIPNTTRLTPSPSLPYIPHSPSSIRCAFLLSYHISL
jgi:hypothetical protein